MRAVKLPTFTGDGQTYQMGSFSGYKLIGCKPQTDAQKGKICSDLALYLTSEEEQLDRYYDFQWGPSNKNAQKNQDVVDNKLLAALLSQNVYSQPQGVIPSDWWTEAAALGTKCKEAGLTEADLKAALVDYETKIQGMLVK
jgi:arabinogalactan oligomer/maltooligosaccharide transport system substrate-binding protein